MTREDKSRHYGKKGEGKNSETNITRAHTKKKWEREKNERKQ